MKKELSRLLKELNDTVPKHMMKSQQIFKIDSEVSPECRAVFNHLNQFDSITVRSNSYGLDCIEDTDILVRGGGGGFTPPHIESRYGRLVLPGRVRFL